MSNPSAAPIRPAAQEPLPQASTSRANPTSKNDHGKTIPSSPNLERHRKRPSISHASVTSYRSNDSTKSKAWDRDDTFLPRAKPPPPLPKLDKHRRTKSQHHIQPPPPLPDPSLHDLPVLDISRRRRADGPPRAQTPPTRSGTRATASSGASDESASGPWRPPPSWAGPHACAEDKVKPPKPARSLSRLGSWRRAQSMTRGRSGAAPEKPKPPEPEVVRLEIVESGEEVAASDRESGRCPSTGVQIQYYEGWHEKSVEDVVHVLRELKLK